VPLPILSPIPSSEAPEKTKQRSERSIKYVRMYKLTVFVLTHYIGSQEDIEIHYHIVLTHFPNLHLWGSFTAKWKGFFSRNVRFLSKTGWLFLKKLKAFCKEHCVNMYISFHNVPGGS